ncbi:MAG TPA: hypothetical protein VM307_10510 [Egibacteraceae bacterium]|nr:hypothetical protein [Egibacteraceae bacterium]
MNRSIARRAATPIAVAAVVLVAAALALQAIGGPPDVAETLMPLAFVALGYLLAIRVPGNALAWLFLGVAALFAFSQAADSLLFVARDEWGALSLAKAGALASSWPWMAILGTVATFFLLLFPDGKLPGRRWRWVAWTAGASIVLGSITLFTLTLVDLDQAVADPYGEMATPPAWEVVGIAVAAGLVVSALASIVSLFVRWRRSHGVARQQLKWFAFGGLVQLLGVVVGMDWWGDHPVTVFVAEASILALPVTAALAILRFRLYDIDRILSRTVAYALLTSVVVAVYLGGVTLLSSVTATRAGDSPAAVAIATLLAAAAFGPARRRIQVAVDRRFNRARYDAARTAEAYRSRLREQLDLEAITSDLAATAGATVQPTAVTVWLRPGGAR